MATTQPMVGERLPSDPSRSHRTVTLDLRRLTITTAIGLAVHDALAELEPGDELDVRLGSAPALLPDMEAWARQTGNELEVLPGEADDSRLRIRKGSPNPNARHVAIVVSDGGLEELLSPLGFALAAALEGAAVSVYLQGPAVRVLRPGYSPSLPWPMRPFSRFARRGLEAAGHVAAVDKLRQLQTLGGRVYACGPSIEHFGVDPAALALEDVTICEYLTFMEVMQAADVQLYP